jgi:TonB family protein
MKEKGKNNKKELSDFLRYSEEKMTDRERNTFERELQKDPFAEEASEGFSEISRENAEADINRLREQLKSRISHRSGMVYFRVAASVAVLMILSSVYIVIEKNKSSKELSSISVPKAQLEIIETEKIKEPESKDEATIPEKKVDQKAEFQVEKKILSRTASGKKGKSEAIKKTETIPVEEKEVDYYKVEDKMAAPTAALAKQEPVQAVSDDSLIIVGYGDAKRSKAVAAAGKAEFDQSGYLPPQPVNGKDSFDKYIEENISKPETLHEGEKAIVVVNFMVKISGAIDSIKILRSPGDEFSKEAIRLIKEGPSWTPAKSNGEFIDDEVRVRIVFK